MHSEHGSTEDRSQSTRNSIALHLDKTADRKPKSRVGRHKTMEASNNLWDFQRNQPEITGRPIASLTDGRQQQKKFQECTDPCTDTAIAGIDLLERSKLQREFEALGKHTVSFICSSIQYSRRM